MLECQPEPAVQGNQGRGQGCALGSPWLLFKAGMEERVLKTYCPRTAPRLTVNDSVKTIPRGNHLTESSFPRGADGSPLLASGGRTGWPGGSPAQGL